MEDTLSTNGDISQNLGDAESSSTKRRDRGSECSHKVIEKRRRDRINTSLGELSQMLPVQNNGKQGSGKLEKAEILEKTVEYLKTLKSHLTELQEKNIKVEDETRNPSPASKQDEVAKRKPDHFGGYKDCTEEVFRFLVNVEAMDMQQPCFQRLMAHLRHQIQLLMESRSDLASKGKTNGKINGKMSNGNRTALKRKSNGTMSSSSSSASSSMEEASNGSGSSSGGKAKRARVHGDSSKEASSSSNGHSTCSSGSSDNENSSDNSREHLSDSAICLDDELVDMPRNTSKETPTRNGINRNSVSIGNTNRNENSTNPSTHGPSMLLQAPNLPLRGPFMPTPYALPTYALHPAGTHYIPIILHPSVPPPPSVSHQMPCGMMPPANGSFGLPPHSQGMFGLPLPYLHPGLSPYGSYQANAMGFPFLNGMCKDFPGQGLADNGNVDSGSNGDECSVESRNSSENIACQTNTPSPSNSGNESSNTDDGGN